MARFNFYANFIQGHTSFVLAHASKKFLCSNFIQIMTKGLDPSTFRMGNISASLKRLRTFSYKDTTLSTHLGRIIIKSYLTSKRYNTKQVQKPSWLFHSACVTIQIGKCNLTLPLVRGKTILAKKRWMMVMFEF